MARKYEKKHINPKIRDLAMKLGKVMKFENSILNRNAQV